MRAPIALLFLTAFTMVLGPVAAPALTIEYVETISNVETAPGSPNDYIFYGDGPENLNNFNVLADGAEAPGNGRGSALIAPGDSGAFDTGYVFNSGVLDSLASIQPLFEGTFEVYILFGNTGVNSVGDTRISLDAPGTLASTPTFTDTRGQNNFAHFRVHDALMTDTIGVAVSPSAQVARYIGGITFAVAPNLTLVASASSGSVGSSVTLTVTATSPLEGGATGTVKFFQDGTTEVASETLSPSGEAMTTINVLDGAHIYTAVYQGVPVTTSNPVKITGTRPGAVNSPGSFYAYALISPSDAVSGGSANLVVRRTGGVGTVTVAYTTVDGTARAGRDYTATSGVLTFAPGQTDQPIAIPLLATALPGQFLVQLSNPTGGAIVTAPGTTTVTISNSNPYLKAAATALAQAGAYFAAGDQANGYFCYAYYNYYLYLFDPTNTAALTAYYENLANAYYLSYAAAGDQAAALAWYNYIRSFI